MSPVRPSTRPVKGYDFIRNLHLHVLHGQLLQQVDRNRDALHAMKRAHDLNPYDPVVQQALAGLYEQFGDESAANGISGIAHPRYRGLTPEESQ